MIGLIVMLYTLRFAQQYSVRPRTLVNLNHYDNPPQLPERNSNRSFQSTTTYSLFGPSNESTSGRKEDREALVQDEDGVYEVLDGEKEIPKRTSAVQRSAIISGGSTLYNQLQFSDQK